jgi:hypothetical protein
MTGTSNAPAGRYGMQATVNSIIASSTKSIFSLLLSTHLDPTPGNETIARELFIRQPRHQGSDVIL